MASPYPELWNRAWLYQRWSMDGRTAREIADELGCTDRTVRLAVTHFDLPRKKRGRRPRPQPVLESRSQLAALYADMRSTTRIAQHLHCEHSAVREAMDRLGIPRTAHIKYNSRAWFARALRRGLTVTAMAAELGCDRRSVYQALARFDLPRPIPFRGGTN